MKINRTYLFIAISSTALLIVLVIQVILVNRIFGQEDKINHYSEFITKIRKYLKEDADLTVSGLAYLQTRIIRSKTNAMKSLKLPVMITWLLFTGAINSLFAQVPGSFVFDGLTRTYTVYVPSTYNPGDHLPL